MKLYDILTEVDSFKSPAWQEGYDARARGVSHEACPHKDVKKRQDWIAGWEYGSAEE